MVAQWLRRAAPLPSAKLSCIAAILQCHATRSAHLSDWAAHRRAAPAEDQWGRSFIFVVNGVPIFAKGSNWIPADSFPTRITDEHLERLIRAAAETHQNMLRVWGGGFYEEERFYDLCDRYGILVWQEFIFSCSVYPLDDPSLPGERAASRRCRTSAACAIRPAWRCGAATTRWNGAGVIGAGGGEPELQDLQDAYDHFFHHTLPDVVHGRRPRPRLLAQLALVGFPV